MASHQFLVASGSGNTNAWLRNWAQTGMKWPHAFAGGRPINARA